MALSEKSVPTTHVDPTLAQALRARVDADHRLPCAVAFALATEFGLPPSDIGQAADALGVRLSRCQLGLFGYPGHAKGWDNLPAGTPMAETLKAALTEAATEKGVTCSALWELSTRFGVSRLFIGYVADQLGLKVRACQLGAF